MRILSVTVPGPVVGIGVDVVRRGRVSVPVARRCCDDAELAAFRDDLDLPFGCREAVLKATNTHALLGAPLREMAVEKDAENRLSFRPGPTYRLALEAKAIAHVALFDLSEPSWAIIVAIATETGAAQHLRLALARVPFAAADAAVLDDTERAQVAGRAASIATRLAAREAAQTLFGDDVSVVVRGGGLTERPVLVGAAGHLSLAHEADFGFALVAT